MDKKSDVRVLRSERLVRAAKMTPNKSATTASPNNVPERRARRIGVSVNIEPKGVTVQQKTKSDQMVPSTSAFIKRESSDSSIRSRRLPDKRPQNLVLGGSLKQYSERSSNSKNIRRSTRDIKRPKFDDEIVDSISGKVGFRRGRASNDIEDGSMSPPPGSASSGSRKRNSIMSPTKSAVMSILAAAGGQIKESETSKEPKNSTKPLPRTIIINEPSCSGRSDSDRSLSQQRNSQELQRRRKVRESRPQLKTKATPSSYPNPIHQGIVDDIVKKWEPEDDILLMAAVHHLCDLQAVLAQCSFSKHFTLADLDERWYLMLYDEHASSVINKRISEQPKVVVQRIYQSLPFITEEDRIIQNSGVNFTTMEPNIMDMDRLLKANKNVFCLWRTASSLLQRYRYLQHYKLIIKRDVRTGKIPTKSGISQMHDEIEQNIDFCNLVQKDVPIDVDTAVRDVAEAEKQYVETKKAPHEAIAGTNLSPQMPANVLAQFRGCCVSFNIVSKQVIIGRSTEQFAVDVNLNYEGPCQRVSRSQAMLKLNDNDDFIIFNIGRNPIFVDKKVLQPRQKTLLPSNTVVEFGILSLLFLRNEAALKPVPGSANSDTKKVFTEPVLETK